MIHLNTSENIQSSGLSGNGLLAGLDLMTSIQVLLVQDYDNQLKHLGNQMKVANQVKKNYRQNIEKVQKMQIASTHKMKDAGGNEQTDFVEISKEQLSFLQQDWTHTGNEFAESEKEKILSEWKAMDFPFVEREGKIYVRKPDLENKVNTYDTRLDTVNEQSELMSLKLQSLTNQRKTAFETVSNVFRKETDTLNTIVGNLR